MNPEKAIENSLEDDVIKDMIDHSYERIVAKLPKYVRNELDL